MIARCLVALCALLAPALAAAADIVIGQVAPLSGPLAPTGRHMQAGAKLYFDAVNARGGVHGAKIRLVTRDDAYKVEDTLGKARELIATERPVAMIGVVGTGNVAALAKERVLELAEVPLIGFRSGAESLVEPVNPYLFLTRATYTREIDKLVEQATTIGANRLAVLYQDDPFGTSGLQAARQAAARLGAQIVATGSYAKNTTSVQAAVATLAKANPQAVLLVANTAASAAFVKDARAAGMDAMMLALSVTDGPQVAQTIGTDVAHGLVVAQVVRDPNNRSLPLVRDLHDDHKRYAPKDIQINHTLLEGYVAARVLVEALRRAGPEPTGRKVRAALEGISEFDVGGMSLGFSPTRHAGSNFVDLTIVRRDGSLLR